MSPAGEGVRLADVADLKEREVLTAIVREDQQYRRVVSYEFRGPVRLGDRVRDAVVAATALPDGYRIETEQEWSWSRREERQIYGVLAVALVLVFMVTAALFESLRQPLVIFLTVPMALIGVFLVFYLAQASFTREAYIGVIMMGGIVVNNAILLVDRVNQLRWVEGLGLVEAIVRGAAQRVRPIFMTSATTIFGLLPLVLFSEYADSNIWNALGYVLIGGLSSSTVLVLTVTPALYWLLERGPERRRLWALGASEEELASLGRRRVGDVLADWWRFLGNAARGV
jgi:HAE1 family hydrophobic/amphiphilic exporter-1